MWCHAGHRSGSGARASRASLAKRAARGRAPGFDGVDGPLPAARTKLWPPRIIRIGASTMQMTTTGLDLAKHVFQVHGVEMNGAVVEKRRLRRNQVLTFFAKLPSCLIGMEACATAHFWARELRRLGHEVRLIPPHAGSNAGIDTVDPLVKCPELFSKKLD